MRILQIIEDNDATECRDKARKAEAEWVKHYLSIGIRLTNISLVPKESLPKRRAMLVRTDVSFNDIGHPELVNKSVLDIVVGDQIEDDLVVSEIRHTEKRVVLICMDLQGKRHWQRYQPCVRFPVLPYKKVAS